MAAVEAFLLVRAVAPAASLDLPTDLVGPTAAAVVEARHLMGVDRGLSTRRRDQHRNSRVANSLVVPPTASGTATTATHATATPVTGTVTLVIVPAADRWPCRQHRQRSPSRHWPICR